MPIKSTRNKHGFRGVQLTRQKWSALILFEGKRKCIGGLVDSMLDAANMYGEGAFLVISCVRSKMTQYRCCNLPLLL